MNEELDGLFETLENDLLSKYQYNLLLNYITNLQKENETNKNYCDFYKDMSDKWKNLSDVYKKNYKDYKSRNEKAIEYIERRNFNNAEILIDMGSEYTYDYDFKEELLNILNGGDE